MPNSFEEMLAVVGSGECLDAKLDSGRLEGASQEWIQDLLARQAFSDSDCLEVLERGLEVLPVTRRISGVNFLNSGFQCAKFKLSLKRYGLGRGQAEATLLFGALQKEIPLSTGEAHEDQFLQTRTVGLPEARKELDKWKDPALEEVSTEERIIVKPPHFLVELGIMAKEDRWWIRKALYGLPTSPRDWGRYRDAEFAKFRLLWGDTEYHLVQTISDDALWVARRATKAGYGDIEGLLVVYVDDLLFLAPQGLGEAFVTAVQERWKTSAPEWLSTRPLTFCGMELSQHDNGYRMSQSAYVKELLGRYGVEESASAPITRWTEPAEGPLPTAEEVKEAQGITGALLWLSTRTRPDLAYVVSRCGQQATKCPSLSVSLGRQALAYLRSTVDVGIDVPCVIGSVPVMWESSRQSFVTLSSAEAELVTMISGVQVAEAVQPLVSELIEQDITISLLADNEAAIRAFDAAPAGWRSRHLRMRAYAARERISANLLRVTHLPGEYQIADMATKPLARGRILQLLELLNIRSQAAMTESAKNARMLSRLALGSASAAGVVAQTLAGLALLAMLPRAKGQPAEDRLDASVGWLSWVFGVVVACVACLWGWWWVSGGVELILVGGFEGLVFEEDIEPDEEVGSGALGFDGLWLEGKPSIHRCFSNVLDLHQNGLQGFMTRSVFRLGGVQTKFLQVPDFRPVLDELLEASSSEGEVSSSTAEPSENLVDWSDGNEEERVPPGTSSSALVYQAGDGVLFCWYGDDCVQVPLQGWGVSDVATIVHGLNTGDWSAFQRVISDGENRPVASSEEVHAIPGEEEGFEQEYCPGDQVERLLETNLVHDAGEANSMPEPSQGNATNSSFGDLARNLEFLLLKVAQLETVVQLQQAELTAAHTEIDSLKEHVGLDVQHVAMAQKKSRDPHAAAEVLRKVLEKHHHQRETRNYDPDAHKDLEAEDHSEPPAGAAAEGAAEALLQRQARSSRKEAEEASEQLLDESLSSKFLKDLYSSTVGKAVEKVDGTGLTGGALKDAFNQVKDQGGNLKAIEFVQKTVIDTVEKAEIILMAFTGFEFSENCNAEAPSFRYESHGRPRYIINFGNLNCEVTLVGKKIELFKTNWQEASVYLPNPLDHLPEQIRTVARASGETVTQLVDMSGQLLNTADCNGDTFRCMAKRVATYVMQFEPPMNFLPHQLHTVVNAGQEAVDRLFSMMTDLLNTAHCDRGNTFDCMAQHIFHWLPQQLHTVVNAGQEGVDRLFSMIRDLLNTAHCDRGNTFECMAQHVFHWLPQQLHTVVNAGQEGVDRVFAMIRDLLNTANCNRGDIFHCMAKRVAGHVMQFEPPLKFMPLPVGVLAGSNVNSVKSLMAMGDDLMDCQNIQSGHEVMKCLGFKMMERVPPLSYLNQLGDVIGEYLEFFAKAGTSLAMKALKGGTSLIEKASVSQFPPVGNMPVRHQQGNLVVE
ncbi:GIP, partial [Symbiodinium microadriaticum]